MLHKLSKTIAFLLQSKHCFEKEELDVYVYGVELVLSSALGILLILTLSIVFSMLWEGLLFLVAFTALRSYTGGYHCYTYLRCNMLYVGTFLICVLLYRWLSPVTPAMWAVAVPSLLGSGGIISKYSPVVHKNKPLDAVQKKSCRKKAVAVYAGLAAAAVVLLLTGVRQAFMLPLVLDIVSAAMLCEIYSQRKGGDTNEKSKPG